MTKAPPLHASPASSRVSALAFALCAAPIFFQTATLAYAQEVRAPEVPATQQIHGISIASMDTSVKPGEDFFEYANGGWIKRTEIPADRASIGVFSMLDDLSNKRTAALIQDAAKTDAPGGSDQRKIADLYNSFMDETAIEAAGLAPLKPHLDAIAAIKTRQQLAYALGATLRADVDALNNTNYHTLHLFGLWIAPDFNDSKHYTAYLLQGGLALPERDYYVSDTQKMKDIRASYQTHVAAMLKLSGFADSDARAARVVELEHSIAATHLPLADNEDVHKANNPWMATDFAAKAPGLDWGEYFRGAGLTSQTKFIVWQPSAFVGESALVASKPLESWKDWLSYHLIEEYAAVLPKALADEQFTFFGTTLTGTTQMRPRWQRGVVTVNRNLGDAVGQIYADRYFGPQAKAEAQAMVANIVAAFERRIAALTWMAPATKAEAETKLKTLYVGVGYPETWHDYSAYEVKPGDIFGNVWRGKLYVYRREIARAGSKVDRHEWSMTPQTVNAVNLPLQNALNFPAAILQPPFFDPLAPPASNYGAIGSIIGHEISHTFDTEGSAFDSEGRVRNWWTAEDLAHFNQATAMLAAQYDTYHPFPDLAVNGRQTLAEDTADFSGVTAALEGYRSSVAGTGAPVKDGFTPIQQFFIAFGQDWGSKTRESAQRQQVATDSHAPAHFRAETVRNVDAWYEAFGVKPGDALYLAPEDRVKIW
ncbi:MAG TPA: M13 family metallopeptidase [Acidisarcina sp.]